MTNREKFIHLIELLEKDKTAAEIVPDSLPFFQVNEEQFNYHVVKKIHEYLCLIDNGLL